METQWPPIGFETLPWDSDPELSALMSKTQRRKIGSSYQAALPLYIAQRSISIPASLSARMAELLVKLARFDAEQQARNYNLPVMLLRSESSASSQIENLTSSARNVALAELSSNAPHNAKLIVGNLAAMKRALSLEGPLTVDAILQIHAALINHEKASFGGQLRAEQVWIGGTTYSPHGATYVPPHYSRVENYLDDLVKYIARDDIDPLMKAAVAHAQLETIHPFIDGNGRTGRVLLHKILRDEEVLQQATLPVSAGLLHNIDSYMAAISEYQQGDPVRVVECLVEALELAIVVGNLVAAKIDAVLSEWSQQFKERKGSSIYRLPAALVEQPVVNVEFLAQHLGITPRAARSLTGKACEYGILRPLGNRKRGEFYQADAIIEVLEEISSIQGIRRVMSGQGL